ncbi:L-2-amino-thiazoline-4-carboxylic acid hydrolase [Corynebacterium mendelii]|uniref:L-2-amino-thiazoline-4-carboxylic acid hydrolase n=1 Tax=Corynebacterium mendelii TaxID=2765362 RepID=A0A939E215_9CORY|nr:L-2-amino-thiazoline-4-carboxylic acid hydrolase [Corynebacterium mendelii]MBN9645015.1 L-2-amino-thiazoline-4-carboxylic acid hydrolase [Corynebacterium mendelii]
MRYRLKHRISFLLMGRWMYKALAETNGRDQAARHRKLAAGQYRRMIESMQPVADGDIMAHNVESGAVFLAFYIVGLSDPTLALSPGRFTKLVARSFDFSFIVNRIVPLKRMDPQAYYAKLAAGARWSQEHADDHDDTFVFEMTDNPAVAGPDGRTVVGFDFHRCGLQKMAEKNHVDEALPALCNLDYILIDRVPGVHLEREQTISGGCSRCTFRIVDDTGRQPGRR